MGSFNISCFATKQTIATGDVCYIIPLRQAQSLTPVGMVFQDQEFRRYGATEFAVGPNAIWEPAGGLIKAVYDDYGRVKLNDTPENRLLLLDLFTDLCRHGCKAQAGKNAHHEPSFDLQAFIAERAPVIHGAIVEKTPAASTPEFMAEANQCWDYLWEVASCNRVFVLSRGEPVPLKFSALHGLAHDCMIAKMEAMRGWDGERQDYTSVFERALEEAGPVEIDLDAAIRKHLSEEEISASTPEDLEKAKDLCRGDHLMDFEMNFRQVFGDVSGRDGMPISIGMRLRHNRLITGYAKQKITKDKLFTVLRPFFDAVKIGDALGYFQIQHVPLATAGLDDINDLGRAYANLVSEVSGDVRASRLLMRGSGYDTDPELAEIKKSRRKP